MPTISRKKTSDLVALFGELLIPFLGFFLWNWNLYFIFLFFFLDLIAYAVLFYFKFKKIEMYRYGKMIHQRELVQFILLLLIGTIAVFVGYSFVLNYVQQTEIIHQVIRFLSYEDMGFPQGYVLLPFLALMAYLQYKTDFLLQGKFTKMGVSILMQSYGRDFLFSFAPLVILGLLIVLGGQSELLLLIIGMTLYIGYKWVRNSKDALY